MRIEVTAQEVGALLQLVELDAQTQSLLSETHRSRREATRRRVPRALLDRYQVLLEGGRLPVIVAIERGGCSGCHVRLPTMLEYKARRSPAIHTCPRCHRMLYAPEFLQEIARSFTSERKPAERRATRGAV
jgi:predicted  nucleic acid-binding Zn-ribbon protein